MVFSAIVEKMKTLPVKVLERLCLSISLLMIIGISSFWATCVEDMLGFATQSNENCIISLLIFEGIAKELKELRGLLELELKVKFAHIS